MEDEDVPGRDSLCRFITPDKWDAESQRPTETAFVASKRVLSVFHVLRIVDGGDDLAQLCVGSLNGAGEALLEADAYKVLATDAINEFPTETVNFGPPTVRWAPDDTDAARMTWRHAHVNVTAPGGKPKFPLKYRVLLAETCQVQRPPQQ